MTTMVDVAVIGAGPAGLAAACVVAQAGFSCLVIDRMGPGGELLNMGEVHDVPGLDTCATGPDLLSKLVDEAIGAGAELVVDEVARVDGIGPFSLATSEGEVGATAIVVATGLEKGTTGVAYEASFEGRGLSHCANCDGPLYADKRVVVVGQDRWAAEETIALAGLVEHVTLVTDGPLAAVPSERRAALDALANLTVIQGRVSALHGGEALDAVMVGAERIPASGLFVLAYRAPATLCLQGLVRRTADGRIAVGENGATSVPGIFACGDVANPVNRVATAIAEGEKAGHNAVRWVQQRAGDG